jgi:hypothetical protein
MNPSGEVQQRSVSGKVRTITLLTRRAVSPEEDRTRVRWFWGVRIHGST